MLDNDIINRRIVRYTLSDKLCNTGQDKGIRWAFADWEEESKADQH